MLCSVGAILLALFAFVTGATSPIPTLVPVAIICAGVVLLTVALLSYLAWKLSRFTKQGFAVITTLLTLCAGISLLYIPELITTVVTAKRSLEWALSAAVLYIGPTLLGILLSALLLRKSP